MDKGIRPHVNAKFLALLPTRVNDRTGNRNFRASVITDAMEQFAVTLASAATHYNHAFINAKEVAKTNEEIAKLLDGLGRPEDKKGGRKPKAKAEDPAAVLEGLLKQVEALPTPQASAAASEVLESNILGNGEQHEEDDAPQEPTVKFTVSQKNGKGEKHEFATQDEAQAYIDANSGQFKPKLIIS